MSIVTSASDKDVVPGSKVSQLYGDELITSLHRSTTTS